jgi:CheY-like chemotaxis protein
LTKDGHVVVNAVNGQEGLDIVISDRNFDCILMDINMPILNGFESTERIRALEKASPDSMPDRISQQSLGRIPIFAVSASLVEAQRDQLLSCGMDGWVLKPIDYKRLNIILRGVTDEAQRELDMYRPGFNWEIGGWLGELVPLQMLDAQSA